MNYKLLLDIVFTFVKIQLLSFGGGHASIPVVQTEVVEIKHWMNMEEFSNLLAMDELTPGPLAINCATFVGKHLAGMPGAIAATIGCIIPSAVITLLFARLYKKYFQNYIFLNCLFGLRCMVIALLGTTFISLLTSNINTSFDYSIQYLIILVVSFFIFMKYKPNPLIVLLLSGLAGLLFNGISLMLR